MNRRHILDTMFYALKSQQRLPHFFRGHSGKKAAGNCRQHIFFIVGAKNSQFILVADFFHRIFPINEKTAVFHINAFR